MVTRKGYQPIPEGEEWRCPYCTKCYPSAPGCWGHMGRAHPKHDPPYQHGTVAGYLKHRRRKTAACPGCKAAWRTYYRLKRAEKRVGL